MAERRMFSKKITSTDAFQEMPASTKCLYYELNMQADDEGFVGNPRTVMRLVGASDDDMKVLIAKRFVLVFDSGVIVIKHWKIHNYIRTDRFKPTTYIEEKSTLTTDQKNAYIEKEKADVIPNVIPNDNQMDTQDRLELEQVRIEVESEIDNCLLEKKDGLTKAEVQEYILASGRKVNVNELWEKTNGLTEYKGEPIRDWKRLVDKWAETDIAVPF